MDTDDGSEPVVFFDDVPFEVGRPAGLKPGTPLDFPVAVNSGPLPLEPGRYEWRLTIDGEADDDWRLPFSVRRRGGERHCWTSSDSATDGPSPPGELNETDRRHDRPHELEQDESPLRLAERVDRQHCRADEVDDEVPDAIADRAPRTGRARSRRG